MRILLLIVNIYDTTMFKHHNGQEQYPRRNTEHNSNEHISCVMLMILKLSACTYAGRSSRCSYTKQIGPIAYNGHQSDHRRQLASILLIVPDKSTLPSINSRPDGWTEDRTKCTPLSCSTFTLRVHIRLSLLLKPRGYKARIRLSKTWNTSDDFLQLIESPYHLIPYCVNPYLNDHFITDILLTV